MSDLVLEIFDTYQPISLDLRINKKPSVSTFARGSNIVFSITSKARYQVPRVTLASDSVYVSIANPLGATMVYRELATKIDSRFVYSYQTITSQSIGAYQVSIYSILNDQHYITPPLIGFILE